MALHCKDNALYCNNEERAAVLSEICPRFYLKGRLRQIGDTLAVGEGRLLSAQDFSLIYLKITNAVPRIVQSTGGPG